MTQWQTSISRPLKHQRNQGHWRFLVSFVLGLWLGCVPSTSGTMTETMAQSMAESAVRPKPTNPKCPADFRSLGSTLVKDLPAYLTRVYSRARVGLQVMGVGQPEFEPLALAPDQDPRHAPEQLFVTVSERYSGEANNQQRAYWLFFVSTPKGWRLAMAFTRVGQAPPYDVSYGAISTATKEWLRDHCDQF
jgi:hypothetical protein